MNQSIIEEYDWKDDDNIMWIKKNDVHYKFIHNELINRVFPVLLENNKNLLVMAVVQIINLIYLKFGFHKNLLKPETLLWTQLIQNKLLDLRAILNMTLPFIDDNEFDDKKHQLVNLEDLYIKKDDKGMYVYTNSQYNRCIRYEDNKKIKYLFRPFKKEYFLNHLELLMCSIETISNKLYVNWVDVLPMTMNEYSNTQLYLDTKNKFTKNLIKNANGIELVLPSATKPVVSLFKKYIDVNPGLSYQDIYNVVANHLYTEIKNHKWLIYDTVVNGSPVSYISYLEKKINLESLFENKFWSHLDKNQMNMFDYQWNKFKDSISNIDNTILNRIYFFFSKYHVNAQILRNQNKLILNKDPSDEDNDEENVNVTPETTKNARVGLANVPIEEIYHFFYDQISAFKKTWYYYWIKIKKEPYVVVYQPTSSSDNKISFINQNIYVTPKNIYNYCKSMTHITVGKKYLMFPNNWKSLKPYMLEKFVHRLMDINIEGDQETWDNPKGNWFNINRYISITYYPNFNRDDLYKVNYLFHCLIRAKLIDIVFQSLICHGLLSDFKPNKEITDNNFIESNIGSKNDKKKQHSNGTK